jgi:hypothetical protein
MAMAGAAAAGRFLLLSRPSPLRLRLLRAALSTTAPTLTPTSAPAPPPRHELLLERLRLRHLKDASSPGSPNLPPRGKAASRGGERASQHLQQGKRVDAVESFEELGLGEEVMAALGEMGISKPTEIQCVGVPAVLDGTSVVLGSHTGSGKTLAYLLPLVQVLISSHYGIACICNCNNRGGNTKLICITC